VPSTPRLSRTCERAAPSLLFYSFHQFSSFIKGSLFLVSFLDPVKKPISTLLLLLIPLVLFLSRMDHGFLFFSCLAYTVPVFGILLISVLDISAVFYSLRVLSDFFSFENFRVFRFPIFLLHANVCGLQNTSHHKQIYPPPPSSPTYLFISNGSGKVSKVYIPSLDNPHFLIPLHSNSFVRASYRKI
jgi:hypothetical protein